MKIFLLGILFIWILMAICIGITLISERVLAKRDRTYIKVLTGPSEGKEGRIIQTPHFPWGFYLIEIKLKHQIYTVYLTRREFEIKKGNVIPFGFKEEKVANS